MGSEHLDFGCLVASAVCGLGFWVLGALGL